jgi:hypothetical protein
MRALPVVVIALAACGSHGDGGGGGDLALAPMACSVSVSGDVTHTFPPCKPTLCAPSAGTTASVFNLAVTDSNLGVKLNAQVMGDFAARGYQAGDLTLDTTFQLVEDIASTMVIYRAVGGLNPPAGQALQMTLTGVAQPQAAPCDGVAHGTIDATLLKETGGGTVTVHATF